MYMSPVTELYAYFRAKVYYRLGQIASMSLVHGGSNFCLLADPIVTYNSGTDITDIVVPAEDMEDAETKILIDQVITS